MRAVVLRNTDGVYRSCLRVKYAMYLISTESNIVSESMLGQGDKGKNEGVHALKEGLDRSCLGH